MPRQLNPNLFSSAGDLTKSPKSGSAESSSLPKYTEVLPDSHQYIAPEPQSYNRVNQKPSLQTEVLPEPGFDSVRGLDAADAQVLSAQLEGLKDKFKEVLQRQGQVESKLEEVAKSGEFKFNRFAEAFRRVENFVKQNVGEMRENYANLAGKMNSFRVNESKIEQMIDRHGQMVQNFEIKVNKLQKIIAEQEIQLMNYKSALEEARRRSQK